MENFCPGCGTSVRQGARFCRVCGTKLDRTAPAASGWSDRADDPEILAAMKKSQGISKISSFFVVPLPLVGFVLYALFTEGELGDALRHGFFVSLVFLICYLFSLFKTKKEKPYEAVVIDKKIRNPYERRRNDDSGRNREEYVTVVQTTTGEIKEIKDSWTAEKTAWSYLQPGERFRYHPGLNWPYELYNKANSPWIFCAGCLTKNAVGADRCTKCGLPLLK